MCYIWSGVFCSDIPNHLTQLAVGQISVNKYLKCLLVLSWPVLIQSDMHLYNKHFAWTRGSSTGTSNFTLPHRGSKHSFTPNATMSKTSTVCLFGMGWGGHNRTRCVALLFACWETWSPPTARRRVEPNRTEDQRESHSKWLCVFVPSPDLTVCFLISSS